MTKFTYPRWEPGVRHCSYRFAQTQMEQLMEDGSESIKAVYDVVREKVDLPVARPAGWHDRAWIRDTSTGGSGEHAHIDLASQPKTLKNRIGNLLRFLRGD